MINYGGSMKLLFTLDSKNYTDDLDIIERFVVRGLSCKNALWAMQKSNNGEYKIPGGGIKKGERIAGMGAKIAFPVRKC
mgnify:CR=1 FL=1